MLSRNQVRHDFHLVEPSPWPIIGAVGAFVMLAGAVFWMHEGYYFFPLGRGGNPVGFVVGFSLALYALVGWWRDVVKEGRGEDHHTPVVKLSFRYGLILFLISETMFFLAWFRGYFVSALFPSDYSTGSSPPVESLAIEPWNLALLNSLILLASVTTITRAHHAILEGDKNGSLKALAFTIALGACFTAVQVFEFSFGGFGIGSMGAVYGSTLLMVLGVYGLHVVVGTIFLIVCLLRLSAGHFTPQSHFGFEAAVWYWRFVVAVWLVLFASMFVLGAGYFRG